jgi:hypothetical protein
MDNLMPKRSEAIKAFLTATTHPDLADLYQAGMEVQVNVAQDSGEKITSKSGRRGLHSFSDGIQKWFAFRIPKKAFTVPEDNDFEIHYDLAAHAEGIGLTGWDWKNRVSKWCAFDFDAISGHSDKHSTTLTDVELKEVKDAACAIPWVTVRLSTSGNGLHLYVFLDDVPTQNHTEHAALGRAILGKMAAVTGFDFASKADACGGVMWVWHRKMTDANQGLKLLKQGEILTEPPLAWRDHVDVIKGKRRRAVPSFIDEEQTDIFDQMTGQRPIVKLDDQHKRLLSFLEETEACWWWDSDRHMLVCHTFDLKSAHKKLNLRGVFDTISKGKEQGADHNCYAFPMDKPAGGWTVRRYSAGIQETSSWDQDSNGFTRCYFNCNPSLDIASRTFRGMEDEKGNYHFTDIDAVIKTVKLIGIQINLPTWTKGRPATLKQHKDGRLIVRFQRSASDPYEDIQGWRENKTWWERIFNAQLQQPKESVALNYDNLARHIVTETGDDYGWVLRTSSKWFTEPVTHVRMALQALDFSDSEIKRILGNCVMSHWVLVSEPFQDEYPGGRCWNRGAAQFCYVPKQEEPFNYPTWQKILDHCGKGLDNSVSQDGWCKVHGIETGADYLQLWVASLFQEPKEPLPYLFLYSEAEKTGKSTFHEALSLLMTSGYKRGDVALVSSSAFNAELENAILCVVEETDLSKGPGRNRIKDHVTSPTIMIHEKGRTPYQTNNYTHWVQTGNKFTECPIFSGDTRITMIEVPEFELVDMIPRKQLFKQLTEEAADFLGMVLQIKIPPSNDRLNVPVIDTDIKIQTQQLNQTPLQVFLSECTYNAPGEMVLYSELYDRFTEWLDPDDLHSWSKIRMGRELPLQYPKGRVLSKGAQFHVGNISFNKPESTDGTKLVLRNNTLVAEK